MSRLTIVFVALGQLVLAPVSIAAPSSGMDACLARLRTAPDSALDYLCLGTPGLPDRAAEVEEILKGVLKRIPDEPHARLYLAMMRLYRREQPPLADFTAPAAEFERRRAPVDMFLAQLALVERACVSRSVDDCRQGEPMMRRANQIAQMLKQPGLLRLAAVARIRWSVATGTLSEGLVAEQELDRLGGVAPPWLQLLEMNTRVVFALAVGDHLKVRELYRRLLAITPDGSVAHGAALAGVAGATARLALQGLASREEAVKLLREAIATQQQLHMENYNGMYVGVAKSSLLLAMLLGPTPEGFRLLDNDRTGGSMFLRLGFLLQGNASDRARALELARAMTPPNEQVGSVEMLARSHTEFTVGSRADAIEWGKQAVGRAGPLRRLESNEALRAGEDWSWQNLYKMFVSDLLDTGSRSPDDVALAFRVSEQLRSQLLLEALIARERDATIPPVPEVTELQSALGPTEALVSFLAWLPEPTLEFPFMNGHSWALVVTKDRLNAVRFADGKALEAAVRAWTHLVDTREGTFAAGAQGLYRDVLAPVVDVLPPEVSSLIVVPDGALHRLPFDALQEPSSRRLVAQRYSISIVPSAAVWLRIRHRKPIVGGTVLAFANTPEGPAVKAAETRGEVEPGRLPPLRYAREEAEDAIAAFPRGGRLLLGSEATPAHLSTGELSRASLVHFASHGVVDRRQPEESFLLLAPASSGNSGKLTTQDIRRLDWSGKTVVLSACDTSVGPVHLGEGVISLARAFFAGGASAVLGTLSEVRDDEQRDLFHAFYAELRSGVPVEDALRQAKQKLIGAGAPPASWANVILLGDGKIAPRAPDPPWRRPLVLVGSVMAAAVALLAFGLRSRRRRNGASSG